MELDNDDESRPPFSAFGGVLSGLPVFILFVILAFLIWG